MKFFKTLLQGAALALFNAPSTGATASPDEYEGMNVLCIACSSGIGKAAAEILLTGGAKVVISSRTQSKCDDVARPFSEKAFAIAADAGKADDMEELVKKARHAFGGKVTHLIWAPTGMAFVPFTSPADDIIMSMKEQMDVNVYGLIRAFKLIEEDIMSTQGAIVTVSSVLGSLASSTAPAYGTSKTAQELVVKHLAAWGAPKGVRVNAVAPGELLLG